MTCVLPHLENEHQRSVNNSESYTFNNQWAGWSSPAKVNVLVGIVAKKVIDTLIDPSKK